MYPYVSSKLVKVVQPPISLNFCWIETPDRVPKFLNGWSQAEDGRAVLAGARRVLVGEWTEKVSTWLWINTDTIS